MTTGNARGRVTGLVFNPWNLLLIIPFVILLNPLYNMESPEFIGMPFFYWFQFLIIPLGVLCTILVYRMTKTVPVDAAPADASGAAPGDAPGDEPDADSSDDSSDESSDEGSER
jgi:hypothetical protein